MDVWDDDTAHDNNDDDFIDQFIIPILDTASGSYKSDSNTFTGVKGIGNLTIAYYNFTIDQLLSTCSVADITTTSITTSQSKNSISYMTCDCFTYMYSNNTYAY